MMVMPDVTHVEITDETADDSIEAVGGGWFVWMVAFAASVAGALFGYDTGIISAVLVYLHKDLDHREMSPNEKELITSLCSGG
jgi:MFS transporter, SP family, solute carrier family 2 (myo-inositol transporter), member 13